MERLHYLVVDGCEVSGDLKRFPKRLRYLQWRAMPYSQIPTTLDLSSLSVLDLSESSKLVELWSNSKLRMQNLSRLQTLKMRSCSSITVLPESIGDLCMLDELDLEDCPSLKNLPESIGQLRELRNMSLSYCESLELLPSSIGALTNLESLDMCGCEYLKSLPDSFGKLSSLRELFLIGNSHLTELPESLGNLLNLKRLDLHSCSGLKFENFPDTLCKLTALRAVELGGCHLGEIPAFLEVLNDLDYLGLANCNLDIDSPVFFSGNTGLKKLSLSGNTVTCQIPELLRRLPHIQEFIWSKHDVDITDVPDGFMYGPLSPNKSWIVIRRKKPDLSLDRDSAALPTD